MIQLTDERAIQAVKAALRWMKTHNVVWLKTEEKIYSRKYDFAGTTDGLAYVDSCDDPACCTENYKHRMCLVDWKTANHLSTINCFQTAAYQQALQEEHNSPIESRWVLRLGKTEEEAGKFEPWFLSNDDFKTDLEAFLACLTLTRLVDSVEERMKSQKGTIRAVKKEQRETAKTLAREQEKLQKALDKAAAKIAREEEKQRVKAEAKAERERLKAEKKAGKKCEAISTTSSSEATELEATMVSITPNPSGSDLPIGCTTDDTVFLGGVTCTSIYAENSFTSLATTSLPVASTATEPILSFQNPTTEVPETPQPVAITSTEAQEYPSLTKEVQNILKSAIVQRPSNAVVYEEEVATSVFKLPMEG